MKSGNLTDSEFYFSLETRACFLRTAVLNSHLEGVEILENHCWGDKGQPFWDAWEKQVSLDDKIKDAK